MSSNYYYTIFGILYLYLIMPQYTEQDLQAALSDVRNGKSLRLASREWGIPLTTLFGRNQGRENHTQASETQ